MSLQVGTSFSKNTDHERAGSEVIESALKNANLKAEEISLAVVFSSIAIDQEKMLKGVNRALSGKPVIGCSTAGEITDTGVQEKSVVAMVIKSDAIKFSEGYGEHIKQDALKAGKQFAQQIKDKGPDIKTIMMMPDVLAGSGSAIVSGVQEVVGKNFIIVGGAPGDDYLFKQTYQYVNDKLLSGGISGVGLSGNFSMGIGVRHGWMPIGDEREVTKAEGAILHELDSKPAAEIFTVKSPLIGTEPIKTERDEKGFKLIFLLSFHSSTDNSISNSVSSGLLLRRIILAGRPPAICSA